MSTTTPMVIARRWRSRRSAAVAGVVFAVLLIVALVMLRLATTGADLEALAADPQRRRLAAVSLNIVPFAGIAFLWFIGVVRDQLGEVEDRLFSTVFLGSGLLFLETHFQGAVTSTSLLEMQSASQPNPGVWGFGRSATLPSGAAPAPRTPRQPHPPRCAAPPRPGSRPTPDPAPPAPSRPRQMITPAPPVTQVTPRRGLAETP